MFAVTDVMAASNDAYWSKPLDELFATMHSARDGLTQSEALARLAANGPNELADSREPSAWRAFFGQFRNPLSWLLLFAVVVSSFAREWTDAVVIFAILLMGATLGFLHERRATTAVAALRARVAVRVTVLRDQKPLTIGTRDVVAGDVVVLTGGSLIPADGVIVDSKDLYVSESVLTGESHAVDKSAGISASDATVQQRSNVLFAGTSVRSGTARMLVVRTGRETEYGRIASRLALDEADTDFDRGLRRFGAMLTRVMFVLVLFTTTANILGHKPAIDALLFAIALAVGLAPEMLPAIVAVNLGRGAQVMAQRGVIVRKLSAIENFGAMNVLCTDKTGTLTVGTVTVDRAFDTLDRESDAVLALANINATLQSSKSNPLDEAITQHCQSLAKCSVEGLRKLDEIPFDFTRKRASVVIERDGRALLVTKGALAQVLSACDRVRDEHGAESPLTDERRAAIQRRLDELAADGTRVLAVATRSLELAPAFDKEHERSMIYEGMLALLDPPKPDAREAIAALARLGVGVKIITGDARPVAVHIANQVGIDSSNVLTGADLARLRDEALWHSAERTTVFAEVDPNQKERVILALRKMGHVVGYMGDGINDAPALHAADVGISVEGATDVAREAAEFVLLERDLAVLREGILAGRSTFANTLKYIQTTESANFGNMLSMALAAAFLPFLPLLATQVLLNNFLSDLPAMAIAGDSVDPEQLERPLRWDIAAIRRFMIVFGLLSSVFDLLTFALLYYFASGAHALFRTGWFVESLLTEVAVALVVRTQRPFYKSRPSRALLSLSALVALVAIALPYTPIGRWVSLVPMPPTLVALVIAITLVYVLSVELAKKAISLHCRSTGTA
jgi:Mg2+-importing ATPase